MTKKLPRRTKHHRLRLLPPAPPEARLNAEEAEPDQPQRTPIHEAAEPAATTARLKKLLRQHEAECAREAEMRTRELAHQSDIHRLVAAIHRVQNYFEDEHGGFVHHLSIRWFELGQVLKELLPAFATGDLPRGYRTECELYAELLNQSFACRSADSFEMVLQAVMAPLITGDPNAIRLSRTTFDSFFTGLRTHCVAALDATHDGHAPPSKPAEERLDTLLSPRSSESPACITSRGIAKPSEAFRQTIMAALPQDGSWLNSAPLLSKAKYKPGGRYAQWLAVMARQDGPLESHRKLGYRLRQAPRT